jgi:peptidoglycan/LPS O-acetylase OafA/YrhL
MIAGLFVAVIVATLAGSLIARTGFPMPPADRRIGCIDGLRGYLAMAVMAHHFAIWLQIDRFGQDWKVPDILFFDQLGMAGVALFFMTTGLVFYPRILMGFRAVSWGSVFIGRIFRILPLIAASVLIFCLIITLRGDARLDLRFPSYAAQWITSWNQPPLLGDPDSGRLNAYVLWTLRLEWCFYLLALPACAFAMDQLRQSQSWLIPLILAAIGLIAQALHPAGLLWPYLPMFAIGMGAYEIQRREHIARHFRTPLASAAAALSLIAGLTLFRDAHGLPMMLCAGAFFISVACGNSLGGLLQARGAYVLSECSYGSYLLHGAVLALLFQDGASLIAPLPTWLMTPLLLPLAVIAVVGLTAITFLLVERPGIAWGQAVNAYWKRRGWPLRIWGVGTAH